MCTLSTAFLLYIKCFRTMPKAAQTRSLVACKYKYHTPYGIFPLTDPSPTCPGGYLGGYGMNEAEPTWVLTPLLSWFLVSVMFSQ